MYACIYELRKNCCGTGGRDGTGRDIEGSTRGPRGPKKTRILMKSFFYWCLWRIQYVNIFHCLKAFLGSLCVLRLDSKGGYQSNRNGMETFLFWNNKLCFCIAKSTARQKKAALRIVIYKIDLIWTQILQMKSLSLNLSASEYSLSIFCWRNEEMNTFWFPLHCTSMQLDIDR